MWSGNCRTQTAELARREVIALQTAQQAAARFVVFVVVDAFLDVVVFPVVFVDAFLDVVVFPVVFVDAFLVEADFPVVFVVVAAAAAVVLVVVVVE